MCHVLVSIEETILTVNCCSFNIYLFKFISLVDYSSNFCSWSLGLLSFSFLNLLLFFNLALSSLDIGFQTLGLDGDGSVAVICLLLLSSVVDEFCLNTWMVRRASLSEPSMASWTELVAAVAVDRLLFLTFSLRSSSTSRCPRFRHIWLS
jgi:hypothetical protein